MHINRVVESEQADVGLSCFFMCVVVWLTTFVITDLVSMYVMGAEASLVLLVQSFYTSIYPWCLVMFCYYLSQYVRVHY